MQCTIKMSGRQSPWSPLRIFCIVLIGLYLSIPYNTSTASPDAQIVRKVSVWPSGVYLGEHFEIRYVLALPDVRSARPVHKRIGPAHIVSAPHLRTSATQTVLKLSLAVYHVHTYGVLTLPAHSFVFQTSNGSKKTHTLPGVRIDVRARYTSTQMFRMPNDPTLPFLRKKRAKQISHEWKALPSSPTQLSKGSRTWIYTGVGCVVFLLILGGFGLRMRSRSEMDPEVTSLTPYQRANEALSILQTTPDAEHISTQCNTVLHTLKVYLHERLEQPVLHLTAHELQQQLPTYLAPLQTQQPHIQVEQFGWIVRSCEPLCFLPMGTQTTQEWTTLLQKVHAFIEGIEHEKQRQEEQRKMEQNMST